MLVHTKLVLAFWPGGRAQAKLQAGGGQWEPAVPQVLAPGLELLQDPLALEAGGDGELEHRLPSLCPKGFVQVFSYLLFCTSALN